MSEKTPVVLATNNLKKLKEIAAALPNYEIKTLKDIGCMIDIPETADSFEGNALLKAKYVWEHYQLPCFSDDSGLVVPSLGGAPGIYSARYAGSQKNDEDNMDLLLKNLSTQSDRSAYFITVICYFDGDREHYFEGRVTGKIIAAKRGTEGFGYDPIFVPDGFDKTFAEMGLDQKNHLSHRAKAVEKLKAFLGH